MWRWLAVATAARRVEVNRRNPGGLRAGDVGAEHVADVHGLRRCDSGALQGERKDARIGLGCAHASGVDDVADLGSGSRAGLTDPCVAEVFLAVAVGIADHEHRQPGTPQGVQSLRLPPGRPRST